MFEARFVPIETWPGEKTKARKNSQFKAGYLKTLDAIEYEIGLLKGKNTIIQAHFSRAQLRNDGWPRGNERPFDPGVILTFETPKGTLSFPCDTYWDFRDNLRAIALALEALRAIDRYGVTRRAEQYQGWLALPPPADQPFQSVEDAATFIATQAAGEVVYQARMLIDSPSVLWRAYRAAAARLHPDNPAGSHELFVRLQAAMKLLKTGAGGE